MANILSPEAQRRLRAMNDVFGLEPEQIQEGLSPLEVGMIAPRIYDAFISAPTRSAIGSAIDGGNLADIGQAAAKQFGSDPELAPSFGFVEDVLADPLALPGVLSGATKLVPKVYSRLKALGEAGSADLGFYSRLKELIQEKMGGKATPEQIMSIARGGKAEEIADVGLEEFVKDKPKLSRAEVLDYLEKQSPTLTETVRKAPDNEPRYLRDELNLPGGEKYREILVQSAENPKAKEAGLLERKKVFDKFQPELDALSSEIVRLQLSPEYDQVKIRSLQKQFYDLMNVRDKLADKKFRIIEQSDKYKSPHWNEPNVLSHIRANERVDDAGRKSLHIEEIQSDWHQAGKKKGYKKEDIPKPTQIDLLSHEDVYVVETPFQYLINPVSRDKRIFDSVSQEIPVGKGVVSNPLEAKNYALRMYNKEIQRRNDAIVEKWRERNRNAIPNAPFKQSWVELSLKKAIKDAVDSGADRLTWTPGKLQADRYNLAKHVDNIQYNRTNNYLFVENQKNGQIILDKKVDESELPKYIGEKLTKKLLSDESLISKPSKLHELSGVDLEIGGEFHKKLYDEKIPNFLKNFGKKYGAKVGFTTINNGVKVPYFEITPELKKAVLSKGLPLYATPIALRLRVLEDGNRE